MTDETGTTVTEGASLPAVETIAEVKGLKELGVYETEKGVVKFFNMNDGPLAENDDWKLFVAELPEPKGQLGLFMIANSPASNPVIDWQEYILRSMQEQADGIDAETELKEFTPNYGAFFPKVFERIDADGRTALVLGYHPTISAYRELKPLTAIPANKRVDLKSIMWILGKSLKLATMFHEAGCTIGAATPDNVFITMDNPEVHGVFYLDFTNAEDGATDSQLKAELTEMATTAYFTVGGTDASEPPLDTDIMTAEQHKEFVANLKRMMSGEVTDARTEMVRLYEINDRIWPKVEIVDGPNSRGQTHKRQWHIFALRNR